MHLPSPLLSFCWPLGSWSLCRFLTSVCSSSHTSVARSTATWALPFSARLFKHQIARAHPPPPFPSLCPTHFQDCSVYNTTASCSRPKPPSKHCHEWTCEAELRVRLADLPPANYSALCWNRPAIAHCSQHTTSSSVRLTLLAALQFTTSRLGPYRRILIVVCLVQVSQWVTVPAPVLGPGTFLGARRELRLLLSPSSVSSPHRCPR